MGVNGTIIIKVGPTKSMFIPSPFRTQAKLSLDISKPFKKKRSQAWILSLLLSQAEPAQLKLFGVSQLELELAW